MLPRNKIAFLIVFMILIIWGREHSSAVADNLIIDFFQDHISAVDGNRCPMTPSCSAYAREAVETHGVFVGWIMACDRLVRCGHDESNISASVQMDGTVYIHDPVSSNDFWWFDRGIGNEK